MNKNRPDAIVRAQMPPSANRNPATPIIIGILAVAIFFLLLLLFMLVIPHAAENGADKESQALNKNVDRLEQKEMAEVNATGSIYPDSSLKSTKMSPLITKMEKPFNAEETLEWQD